MNKYLIFLFTLIFLFISLGLSSNVAFPRNHSAFNNPAVTPTPQSSMKIEKIELDKEMVVIPCPPTNSLPTEDSLSCNDNMLVTVKTSVKNAENVSRYNYSTSGGHIVGKGAIIAWDLSGVRPGNYTITVDIEVSSKNLGKSLTKNIEVKEYVCCLQPCSCPTISVISPTESIKAGEIITFEADMSGNLVTDVVYNWSVSQGEIIEGQGKSKINVRTTSEMAGSKLTATVDISGTDPACNCPTQVSETVSITSK
jgi:hypothetical protein